MYLSFSNTWNNFLKQKPAEATACRARACTGFRQELEAHMSLEKLTAEHLFHTYSPASRCFIAAHSCSFPSDAPLETSKPVEKKSPGYLRLWSLACWFHSALVSLSPYMPLSLSAPRHHFSMHLTISVHLVQKQVKQMCGRVCFQIFSLEKKLASLQVEILLSDFFFSKKLASPQVEILLSDFFS